jgi:hypothetical protein
LAGCTEQIFPKEKEEGLNDEDVRLSPDVWGADAGDVLYLIEGGSFLPF